MSGGTQAPWVKVWDPVVRYGHWALVAAFAVAYLSAEEDTASPDQVHVWGGYAVGAIVLIRVLWGFVGTAHARFSDFAYGPASALRYLGDMLGGRARRYIGHSPAGAVMVFALLGCLAGTVGTGIVAYGNAGGGPLANAMTFSARAEESEMERPGAEGWGKETESVVGDIHAALANITLGLVIVHVLGVGLASVMHRENLVASMFSGRKRATLGD
jgi:cytochrome b